MHVCRYEGTHNGAAGLFNLAGMAAGVRLTFLTTAEELELTVCSRACGPGTKIDLCIGNDLLESQNIGAVAFEGSTPDEQEKWAATWSESSNLKFAGLPTGQKRVELWLPHVGICKVVSLTMPSTAQTSSLLLYRPRHRPRALLTPVLAGPHTARLSRIVARRTRPLGLGLLHVHDWLT